MDQPRFLTGQFLLALPGIGDPRFERAAIAICAHDDRGALGVGLGKLIPRLTLHGLLAQVGLEPGAAPDIPVHSGGPVEPQRGFVLHSADWAGEDSVHVAGKWTMTGTLDVLRAIAAGKGPSRFVVALGYAGWDAGQLDAEMTRHGWLAVPGDDVLLYDTDAASRWERAFTAAGIDPRLLAPETGHA